MGLITYDVILSKVQMLNQENQCLSTCPGLPTDGPYFGE